MSSFAVTSIDNIIISTFTNIISVGIYSNYALFTSILKTIFSQIFSAFTTSFGNLIVSNRDRAYNVFLKAHFFAFYFSATTSVIYLVLIQEFIEWWLGKEYLFGLDIPVFLCLSYYFTNMNIPLVSVQNASALHQVDKYIVIAQALFNLVFSVILVKYIGISGVVIATIISTIIFPTFSKPYVIYKYVFQKNTFFYFKVYLLQLLVFIIMFLTTFFICFYIRMSNIYINIFLKGLLSIILTNFIIFLFYSKTDEYKFFLNLIKSIIQHNKKNNL